MRTKVWNWVSLSFKNVFFLSCYVPWYLKTLTRLLNVIHGDVVEGLEHENIIAFANHRRVTVERPWWWVKILDFEYSQNGKSKAALRTWICRMVCSIHELWLSTILTFLRNSLYFSIFRLFWGNFRGTQFLFYDTDRAKISVTLVAPLLHFVFSSYVQNFGTHCMFTFSTYTTNTASHNSLLKLFSSAFS